jgi:hypothetical protein
MGGKAAMQDVWVNGENLIEGIDAEPALFNSIIPG